jgi:hypothetical protein
MLAFATFARETLSTPLRTQPSNEGQIPVLRLCALNYTDTASNELSDYPTVSFLFWVERIPNSLQSNVTSMINHTQSTFNSVPGADEQMASEL